MSVLLLFQKIKAILVDSYIISKCCKGDRKGHQLLYEACIGYVYSIVKRYIYQEEDRRDLVQDTFAKVFNNIESYNPKIGTFNIWIRRVAINECLMHLRKTKRLVTLAPVELDENISGTTPHGLEKISREDILNILEKMPKGYKTVFMLSVIDEYNHREIGEMLNIKEETSRSQLNRARKWAIKNLTNIVNKEAYGLL